MVSPTLPLLMKTGPSVFATLGNTDVLEIGLVVAGRRFVEGADRALGRKLVDDLLRIILFSFLPEVFIIS